MPGARTRHGSRKYKGGSRKQKNAYCASARSEYSGASLISCVTSYFLLHAADFVRKFHDCGHEMTWGATPHPLYIWCDNTIAEYNDCGYCGTNTQSHPERHSMQGARTRSVESPSGCHRLKSPIDCTILALGRINEPPNNQQAA
jgi:hypothetical protein